MVASGRPLLHGISKIRAKSLTREFSSVMIVE